MADNEKTGKSQPDNLAQDDSQEVSKDAKVLDDWAASVAERAAKGVSDAMQPLFAELGKSLEGVAGTLKAIVEKGTHKGNKPNAVTEDPSIHKGNKPNCVTEKGAEETRAGDEADDPIDEPEEKKADDKKDGETDADKSVDLTEVLKAIRVLAEGLKATQEKVAELSQDQIALQKAMPGDTVRDERVEEKKSAPDDPNACFDTMLAFLR